MPAPAATIAAFLAAHNTMALATAGAVPHVAPLFYVPGEGLRLFWFSSARSAHSRALKSDPQAAVTVFADTADWRHIRGVQMRGRAMPVRSRRVRGEMARAYRERFGLSRAFDLVMARSTLFCFEPTWARYVDNTRRFGYRFEIELPAGEPPGAALP